MRLRRLGLPLLLVVFSLFAGLLAQAPPAKAKAVPPAVKHDKPVPVHKVQGKKASIPKQREWHPSKVSWPSASTAAVTPGSSAVRAGSTPVSLNTVPKAAAPGKLQVSMEPRSAATGIGIPGVVFTVGRAAGTSAQAAKAGKAQVSVDYSSFKDAYGSDYASSLRLVELPACALTTPKVAACRKETPLAATNDTKADTVSAAVPVPAAANAGTNAGSAAATNAKTDAVTDAATETDAATVVAATPGPSGSGGDYSATKLSEAGSWAEGGDSGAFTYSYPISTPAVPGGLQPTVSLGYNSQTVDGLTSSTNNQASWIGDGWNYDPGSIQRTYVPCSDPDSGAPAGTSQGDMCYSADDDSTTLNLNGQSTTLVQGSDGSWHAQADGNEKVQYLTGASNSTGDGGYWKVTEPDGTQYFFGQDQLPGYASGDASANSAWNVPVYDYGSSGPCAGSHCYEPWQWKLDYVVSPHGDAESYFYSTEQNYYASGSGATTANAAYVQGGALSKIEYGFRNSDGAYAGKQSGEVDFTAPEDRKDFPSYLACASGAACTNTSPTFWSKYRLATIATKAMSNGSLSPVDSWALSQSNPVVGDTTSDEPPLWLDSITQTGQDGGSVQLPPVTFGGTGMPNRAETTADNAAGYSDVSRRRLTSVTNQTGGTTTVSYTPKDTSCSEGNFPTPDANTALCYPDNWIDTANQNTKVSDWFNKYAVQTVTEHDRDGADPDQVTNYAYSGAAWHYTEDTTSKDGQRTWDNWRGFRTVTTETGASPDTPTKKVDTYLQGMDGDHQADGSASSVSLTTSQGNDTVTDSDQYQGQDLESVTYNGTTGAMVTDTVTLPWSSAATAQQSQPSPIPELQAFHTGTKETKTYTALAGGGNRESDTTNAYDSDGRVVQASSVPDTSDASQDTCTTTSYAENTDAWIMNLSKEVKVVSVPCGTTPSYPDDAISDTLTYYDGATSQDSDTPTKGDVTETQLATSYDSDGNPQYTTQTASTFDSYGRVLTSADADNRTTTTSYSPASGAEPSQETVTDPQGLQTVTTYDQARNLPLTTTSPAGLTTTEKYDALGRLTAVWQPGDATSGPATEKFAYTVDSGGSSYTVTSTLDPDASGYLDSVTVYDSLGQTVESQEQQPGGGWDVSDTTYDSSGNQTLSAGPYYAGSITEGTLVKASTDDVADETDTVYDGAGRPVQSIAENKGTQTWETDTAYGGNYTTTSYKCSSSVPKCGGTPKTTFTDGRGLQTAVYQYHAGASPDPADSSSDYDKTSYSYFPSQKLKQITDAAGNKWSYTYDLKGDELTDDDPDSGKTTDTYDAAGQLLTSTDARGKEISSVYDKDGRQTASYDTTNGASETSSDEIASWTYDTLAKGQLTSSSSYYNGDAYTEKTLGYNAFGEPTGTEVTIPSSAGKLAGNYITMDKAYAKTGELESYQDSQAGNLPAETVNYAYDKAGDPTSVTGTSSYVSSLSYDELGNPQQYSMGSSSKPAYVTDSYDPQTNALTDQTTSTGTTPKTVDDLQYAYDNIGDVTSENDQPSGGSAQSQCFQYDYLGRLSTAWSQGSACSSSSSPSASAEGGAAAPYWDTYSYNTIGNLTKQTSEAPNGTTTTTTGSFPSSGSAQPHAPSSETQVGTTTATTNYSYDADGDLTKSSGLNVTGLSLGGQDLSWDDAGRLTSDKSSSGTSDYVYDADGNLLIEDDPGQDTLFLPDEQIVLNTGTGTLSGTRFYSIGGSGGSSTSSGASGNASSSADSSKSGSTGGGTTASNAASSGVGSSGGATVASRSSSGEVDYLVGDQQGTAGIAVKASDLSLAQRYYDPYGNPVAPAQAQPAWPGGNKGFVGGTSSQATGLTNLGAREYQPQTEAFVSPDDVINPDDPQDLNAYAYASDNPATDSDPTGQMACAGNGSTGCSMPGSSRVSAFDGCAGGVNDSSCFAPRAGVTADSPPPAKPNSGSGGGGGGSHCGLFSMCTLENVGKSVVSFASDQLGLPTIAQCITNPTLGGCLEAGFDVAMDVSAVMDFGESFAIKAGVKAVAEGIGKDVAKDAGETAAKDAGKAAAKDAGKDEAGNAGRGATCSFSSGTGVLLASGKTVPISSLRPGDTVLATNAKTGKTSPEKVSAVDVHRDHDLYDLKVKSGGRDSVIHTTSSHRFWDPVKKQWVTAGKLAKGEHLKTADGTTATADGGTTPRQHTGWMWDLTVPGNNDHDFYVIPTSSLESQGTVESGLAVLVHNCKLWTKTDYKGQTVYQRDDLINPDHVSSADKYGRTNLKRMQQGLAPVGPDDLPVNLHHMLQTQDGPIAEVAQSLHLGQGSYGTLHINVGSGIPSGIDRDAFNAWKSQYWKDRAAGFLSGGADG